MLLIAAQEREHAIVNNEAIDQLLDEGSSTQRLPHVKLLI